MSGTPGQFFLEGNVLDVQVTPALPIGPTILQSLGRCVLTAAEDEQYDRMHDMAGRGLPLEVQMAAAAGRANAPKTIPEPELHTPDLCTVVAPYDNGVRDGGYTVVNFGPAPGVSLQMASTMAGMMTYAAMAANEMQGNGSL